MSLTNIYWFPLYLKSSFNFNRTLSFTILAWIHNPKYSVEYLILLYVYSIFLFIIRLMMIRTEKNNWANCSTWKHVWIESNLCQPFPAEPIAKKSTFLEQKSSPGPIYTRDRNFLGAFGRLGTLHALHTVSGSFRRVLLSETGPQTIDITSNRTV